MKRTPAQILIRVQSDVDRAFAVNDVFRATFEGDKAANDNGDLLLNQYAAQMPSVISELLRNARRDIEELWTTVDPRGQFKAGDATFAEGLAKEFARRQKTTPPEGGVV